jgi:hypothetical protein
MGEQSKIGMLVHDWTGTSSNRYIRNNPLDTLLTCNNLFMQHLRTGHRKRTRAGLFMCGLPSLQKARNNLTLVAMKLQWDTFGSKAMIETEDQKGCRVPVVYENEKEE